MNDDDIISFYDSHTKLKDQFGEYQTAMISPQPQIESVNAQRKSLTRTALQLNCEAYRILTEYSEALRAECIMLRTKRKGIKINSPRAVLDTSYIWADLHGHPIFWTVTVMQHAFKNLLPGNYIWGLATRALQQPQFLQTPNYPLTSEAVTFFMTSGYYPSYCRGVLYRGRGVPSKYLRDIRLFKREDFTTPLLSDSILVDLFDTPFITRLYHMEPMV